MLGASEEHSQHLADTDNHTKEEVPSTHSPACLRQRSGPVLPPTLGELPGLYRRQTRSRAGAAGRCGGAQKGLPVLCWGRWKGAHPRVFWEWRAQVWIEKLPLEGQRREGGREDSGSLRAGGEEKPPRLQLCYRGARSTEEEGHCWSLLVREGRGGGGGAAPGLPGSSVRGVSTCRLKGAGQSTYPIKI